MKARRFLIVMLVLVAGGAATAWLQRQTILPSVARWLDVGTTPRRVDGVFILPGDEQVRPFVAAALVKAGFADVALFPENAPLPDVIEGVIPSNQEIIRRVLTYRGLTDAQIVELAGDTETTVQDLQALGRYLRQRPEIEVAVVTSDYHTRRVRWLASRLLGDDARRLCYVSAPVDDFSAEDWWQRPSGFSTITSEYLKLAFVATQSPWVRGAAVGLALVVVSGVVLAACRRRMWVKAS